MITALLGITILLVLIIVFQLGRIADNLALLKGDKKSERQRNNLNGYLMLAFGIAFLVLIVWSTLKYDEKFLPPSASIHGVWVDNLFNITLLFTGIVFILTQVALFYFAYRYRHTNSKQKALFYPRNDKLEIVWTIIPAIVLTGLIVWGAYRWYQITTASPPENALVIEATGKQFNWIIRYPGEDEKLGEQDFRVINKPKATNGLGLLKKDEHSHDDIITQSTLHLPADTPVIVKIRSRDVLHSFYLPHFRVKMDAVPGIPTQFWFEPRYTTEEMQKRTGNDEFSYELACAELCGKGHSSMKLPVVVEPYEEYKKWLDEQMTWKKRMQQTNNWEGLKELQEKALKDKHSHKKKHDKHHATLVQ